MDAIAEGGILIKYPIDGEPQQEIDLSSEEIFMLYEVCQVKGAQVRLQLPEDQQPQPGAIFTSQRGEEPVWFSKQDLVRENVWWIK